MSKPIQQIEREQKVFSILQTQIDNQRQQAETAQLMLNEMRSIRDEINTVKAEVGKKFEVMSEMVQEVRDSITLNDAECVMLQSAVASKSNSLAKDRYSEEDESFTKVVGKHRRMIWKQLKIKYNVPRYTCIRRIDFKDAMNFVETFRPEEYM